METEILLLTLYDNQDDILCQKKLTSVPLKEESIIGQSVEIYNDPEPCMIHRSAVMSRMYMEIYKYFITRFKSSQRTFLFRDLPDKLSSYFGIGHIYKIKADIINITKRL